MDLVKCIGPVGHSNVTQLQTGGADGGAGLGHGGGQLPPCPPARAAHVEGPTSKQREGGRAEGKREGRKGREGGELGEEEEGRGRGLSSDPPVPNLPLHHWLILTSGRFVSIRAMIRHALCNIVQTCWLLSTQTGGAPPPRNSRGSRTCHTYFKTNCANVLWLKLARMWAYFCNLWTQ